MIEALGNRVIIEPDKPKNKHDLGNGKMLDLAIDERAEKSATSTGTVVALGDLAYLDPILGGEPWVNVGDHVIYAKYSGKFIIDPDDEKEYVVINDDAIQARIEKCQK